MAAYTIAMFEPHHIITIDYPALDFFNENGIATFETKELALPAIENSQQRFEPKALIRDDAVEAHSGGSSLDENQIFSVMPATIHTEEELTALLNDPEFRRTEFGLMQYMGAITKAHGQTTLSCISRDHGALPIPVHQDSGNDDDDFEDDQPSTIVVNVLTVFKFRCPAGERKMSSEYLMTLRDFDAIDTHEPWLAQLRSLMRGTTDRAVRHMQLQLDSAGVSIPKSAWKPPRLPDYTPHISTISTPINAHTLPHQDRACIACTSDLATTPGIEPLVVGCNNQHTICKTCLLTWLDENAPDTASCPQCRRQIFTDKATLDWLKFSVRDRAYYPDPRYNDWENFVRSCADLDHELADSNADEILDIDAELMTKVWRCLMDGEALEPETSTPLIMQSVKSPECEVLNDIVRTTLRSLDGATLMIQTLYSVLVADINRGFARRILRGSVGETLSDASRYGLAQGYLDYELGINWRPGFEEFWQRSISRMLQFVQLRVCGGCCWGGRGVKFGWHGHGLRMHYRPRNS